MIRTSIAMTLALACQVAIATTHVEAAVFLALTGFNDASGINSNATPNSPYTLGGTLGGSGAGEPGWATTWTPSAHTVQTSVVLEGDGAAQLNPSSQTWRNLSAQLENRVLIETHVQMTAGASMVAYTMQLPGNEIDQGPIWQIRSDGTFWVIDGEEDGAIIAPAEYTGFDWTPGEWYKITVDADLVTRAWSFYVNDVRYNAPDPLGFRGNPTNIEQISYLVEGTGIVYMDALTIVPEPTSMLLAAFGVVPLATFAWRRRKLRRCAI